MSLVQEKPTSAGHYTGPSRGSLGIMPAEDKWVGPSPLVLLASGSNNVPVDANDACTLLCCAVRGGQTRIVRATARTRWTDGSRRLVYREVTDHPSRTRKTSSSFLYTILHRHYDAKTHETFHLRKGFLQFPWGMSHSAPEPVQGSRVRGQHRDSHASSLCPDGCCLTLPSSPALWPVAHLGQGKMDPRHVFYAHITIEDNPC